MRLALVSSRLFWHPQSTADRAKDLLQALHGRWQQGLPQLNGFTTRYGGSRSMRICPSHVAIAMYMPAHTMVGKDSRVADRRASRYSK